MQTHCYSLECFCVCVSACFFVMCLFKVSKKSAWLRSAKSSYCSGDRLFRVLMCVVCLPATYCHASAHQAWHISQPLSSGLMTHGLKCTLSNSCLPTAQHLEWQALFPPNPILKWRDGCLMSWYIAAWSNREVMRGKETKKLKCFIPVFSSVSLLND